MSKQSFSIFEVFIAVGALVTSGAAVVITMDQARVMHSEQEASVLPAIQIDSFLLDEGSTISAGFNIENAGVGPAFLQSATLSNKEGPIKGLEHLQSLVPTGMTPTIEQMSGRVIAPGVEKQAILMRWRSDPLEPTGRSEINTKTGDLAFEVCYCSTLGKCWISKSDQRTHPKAVDKCAVPKDGLF